ncbi:MAG: YtxH domain-containing protein [Flavobacterium sp.]|nr:YtxH domain-containing protein [Pedobacter sp.]
MGFIKSLVIGAALVAGVNYITKKRPDGTSLVDDIKDKAPEWINKAKDFANQKKDMINQNSGSTFRNPNTMDNF